MSNGRRPKSEMKQIYMIRRIVALLILVLILVVILNMCKKKDDESQTSSQSQVVTTDSDFNQIPNNNQVIVPNQPNNPTESNDIQGANEQNNELTEVISTNLRALQEEYAEYADVDYNQANNAFNFTLKGEYRSLIYDRENPEKATEVREFWDEFKADLITTSETLAETIEPGIEIHVLDPDNDSNTLLFIRDGAEVFDMI